MLSWNQTVFLENTQILKAFHWNDSHKIASHKIAMKYLNAFSDFMVLANIHGHRME